MLECVCVCVWPSIRTEQIHASLEDETTTSFHTHTQTPTKHIACAENKHKLLPFAQAIIRASSGAPQANAMLFIVVASILFVGMKDAKYTW